MTTRADLVNRVLAIMHGYTRDVEPFTVTTASVLSTDTTISVADGSTISRGLIEIDNELIWVDSVAGSVVTVLPGGRGALGTTAAAHSTAARVTSSPLFPKFNVINAINETILEQNQVIYQVATTTFTPANIWAPQAMPAGTVQVIDVAQQEYWTGRWAPLLNWRYDPEANTVEVNDAIAGYALRVVYTPPATPLVNDTDLFSVANLPATSEDMVVYGACWRLAASIDPSRLTTLAVGQDIANSKIGDGRGVAGVLQSVYEKRRHDEKAKMLNSRPGRIIRGVY